MIHPRNIIISPIITEKSSNQIERTNTYSFKVSINANKIDQARHRKDLFGESA